MNIPKRLNRISRGELRFEIRNYSFLQLENRVILIQINSIVKFVLTQVGTFYVLYLREFRFLEMRWWVLQIRTLFFKKMKRKSESDEQQVTIEDLENELYNLRTADIKAICTDILRISATGDRAECFGRLLNHMGKSQKSTLILVYRKVRNLLVNGEGYKDFYPKDSRKSFEIPIHNVVVADQRKIFVERELSVSAKPATFTHSPFIKTVKTVWGPKTYDSNSVLSKILSN